MPPEGTGMPGSSNSRPRLSIRREPLPTNPAVVAAGFSETVNVNVINYVAQRIDYDAEECIQKALEDNEIEMYAPSRGGNRGYDVYRLTARGRKAADRHLRKVFEESARLARRRYEAELAGDAWPAAGRSGGGGGGRVAVPVVTPKSFCGV